MQTTKGRICINKEGKKKYIKPCELDSYIKEGWLRGGLKNTTGTKAGTKIWIKKGDSEQFISKKQEEAYLKDGWERGRILTNEWFKGTVRLYRGEEEKTVKKKYLDKYLSEGWERGFSKSTKEKLSKANKGKGVLYNLVRKYGDDEGYRRFVDSLKGRVPLYRGEEHIRVLREDIDSYLKEGWLEGVPQSVRDKLSKAHRGKGILHKLINKYGEETGLEIWQEIVDTKLKGLILIRKGNKQKMVTKDNIELYEKDGWRVAKNKVYKDSLKPDEVIVTNGLIEKAIRKTEMKRYERYGYFKL